MFLKKKLERIGRVTVKNNLINDLFVNIQMVTG